MKSLKKLLSELPPGRRKKVAARTVELIAEELTLQELRKAHQKTQAHMAKTLGMTQDQVSRLEKRSDVLVSTLRRFVEGMGGDLSIVAEFPDYGPVKIAGFSDLPTPSRPRRRRARKAQAA